MKVRQERDPLWARLVRPFGSWPWWAFWLLGYLVIVPIGFLLGATGISGTLADTPQQGRIGMAIALGLGWTACGWFLRNDSA